MARSNGNTFENHLGYWKNEQIGAINWGLVSGKSNTIFPWGHPQTKQGEQTIEPDPWFHDVFRIDGTPYSQAEVDLIQRLTSN